MELNDANKKDVKEDLKEYIFDLNKTLEITFGLLHDSIQNLQNSEEKTQIIKRFKHFKDVYERKMTLYKKLKIFTSKSLIENQIYQETKRKIEENNQYYKDQIGESEENLEGKVEYIKIFEKKLNEVEVYIQKITKKLPNGAKFAKYKGWKMGEFLDINCNLVNKQSVLKKEIVSLQSSIDELKRDNELYEEDIKNCISENEKEKGAMQKKRIKEYIELYKRKILVIQARMKILRNSYQVITNTLKYLNLTRLKLQSEEGRKTIENENEVKNGNVLTINDIQGNDSNLNIDNNMNNRNDNINLNNNTFEKSVLPLDLTRRINNFMDFSIVLNKKNLEESKIDEFGKTILGGNLGNVTNLNMWDISVINKK